MTFHEIPDSQLPDEVPTVSALDQVPKDARQFQGHRAGVVTRTIANAIDFAVIVGMLGATYVLWFSVDFIINTTEFKPPKPNFAWIVLIGFVYLWIYLAVSWMTAGRTIGNLVMGLRVVNWRGDKMRWLGAILRATFCAWFIPGFFWVAISRQNRSVQDVVLRTSVIYDWTRRQPKVPTFDKGAADTRHRNA